MIETIKATTEAKIARLNDSIFPDGTYNLDTMKPVEFSTGYQVTFSQIGDAYTDDEYEFLVAMFREMSSDGAVYAGKFGGYPEISFHFSNRDLAVKLAKKFNQYSVWNWKIYDNLITGGTGIRG